MKFLCYTYQTLQYRSLLPVVQALIQQGMDIYMYRRGVFDEQTIPEHPKNVWQWDEKAIEFVAKNTGLSAETFDQIHWIDYSDWKTFFKNKFRNWSFGHVVQEIRYLNEIQQNGFDGYLSTIKGFKWLNEWGKQMKPQIAIAYQNILDSYVFNGRDDLPELSNNHIDYFLKLREDYPQHYLPSGLPFMDVLVKKRNEVQHQKSNKAKVLLLHPGGRRGVISNPEDSRETCVENQRILYRSILSSLPNGMTLVVKIHPLAARYHETETTQMIADEMGFEISDGWLGDVIFDCHAVLGIGSSAFFEIVPLGVPYWNLMYFGNQRTQYYQDFTSCCIYTEEKLTEVLQQNIYPEPENELEKITLQLFNQTCDGKAVERIVQRILAVS